MSVRKSNQTLASHIQRYGFQSTAPVAPEPEDPSVCRWCAQPKNIAGFCQAGCAIEAVERGVCQECRREFRTGKRGALLCFECDRRDERQHVNGYRGSGYRPDEYAIRRRRIRGEQD
jgi:hypothetical protein